MSKTDDNLARLDARDKGKSSDPMGYVMSGLIVSVIGAVALGFGIEDGSVAALLIGGLLTSVGTIITLIGTVAFGVLVGLRARARD